MNVDVAKDSTRKHERPMLIYTLAREHIDSAQLRGTSLVGRSVQWTPNVGGTVPCSADLKVIAVSIS